MAMVEISRPEVEGQRLALQRAYRRAGFGVETVGYFEGHGTGTPVGDATELEALNSSRLENTGDTALPQASLGSVKANIGHTKAAAGVAGLIKATMALQTQILPPTTACSKPHEALATEKATLKYCLKAISGQTPYPYEQGSVPWDLAELIPMWF